MGLFRMVLAREQRGEAFSTEGVGEKNVVPAGRSDRKYLLIFRRLLPVQRMVFYLKAPGEQRGSTTMTDLPHRDPIENELSLENWLIAIATALLALLIAALPYVRW
jgi:hypothetical protein